MTSTTKKKILLLEDDPNLGFILQENLELRGYQTRLCTNGVDGLAAFREGGFALCLVDVMMPKKDGFSFARDLRQQDERTPVIFLTAKSMKEDRIEGFHAGADDYVTKPFSMEELVLRIQAVLRRTEAAPDKASEVSVFTIGSYGFDFHKQLLSHADGDQKLTGREAELLRLLCLHANKTLERETALKQIWGDDTYFNSRSMDVFISRLRSYLKRDQSIEIVNVHGKGYRLMLTR